MQKGWWYQNDDGTYLKDGWKWVNGKCYYFTSDGYCLTGTQTPDGYTVDASGPGSWTASCRRRGGEAAAAGQNTVTVGSLTFAIPEGFPEYSEDEAAFIWPTQDSTTIIGLASGTGGKPGLGR